MKIGIVTNLNGRGLERDARLLVPLLDSAYLIQYDQPCEDSFDLLIFLEVAPRNLVRLSKLPPWLIANPEFLIPETIKTVQRSFGRILCKTHEAHRICKELFGDKAHYVGFISEDRYDAKVERQLLCLHISGQSKAKNTSAIIDAWRWKRNGESLKAKLIVVSDFPVDDLPEGVLVLSKISDEALRGLQNECQIHLQPSATEGFGHVLHESMSVNASILTVDAAPMNEIHAVYKVPSTGSTLFNSVKMHEVSAIDVHCAVQDMVRLGRNGFSATGMPRKEFLDGNEAFKKAFAAQLADLESKPTVIVTRVKSGNPSIAFIGNFEAEHSTENQIKWALEQGLGYEVETLQENKTHAARIMEACDYSDTLIWVRTPGWLKVPDDEMFALLHDLHKKGIKTLSVHLDKFWGIPDREFLIGKIPFWKTQYVFTADGSRQEDFKARGVNHFWMRPAVSEVYCHPGTPRDEYRCDVGFVGAGVGYHNIYPFRQELLRFLKETYGQRFKHIEGVRGHLLNDAYASMKIAIGDCFAAGTPMYASDRIMETCGRFGFLLHPEVQGFEDIPCALYKPQNLEHLKTQIEYCLGLPEQARRAITEDCADTVREWHTWTRRMEWILRMVNHAEKEHATSAD